MCLKKVMCKFLSPPTLRNLHMKFELNWSSGFREDPDRWLTEAGGIGILIAKYIFGDENFKNLLV